MTDSQAQATRQFDEVLDTRNPDGNKCTWQEAGIVFKRENEYEWPWQVTPASPLITGPEGEASGFSVRFPGVQLQQDGVFATEQSHIRSTCPRPYPIRTKRASGFCIRASRRNTKWCAFSSVGILNANAQPRLGLTGSL
jgi:hypothetical protein